MIAELKCVNLILNVDYYFCLGLHSGIGMLTLELQLVMAHDVENISFFSFEMCVRWSGAGYVRVPRLHIRFMCSKFVANKLGVAMHSKW